MQQPGMRLVQQSIIQNQPPGQVPTQIQLQQQQGLPHQQQLQHPQPGQIQSPVGSGPAGPFIMQQQRITAPQWRSQTPVPGGAVANLINPLNKAAGPSGIQPMVQPQMEATHKPIQMYQANLQPAPPVPPENITNDQERQTQITYEN